MQENGRSLLEINAVTDVVAFLGESPVWDVDDERLYWIDARQGSVFSATADGRELRTAMFPGDVSSMAPRAGGGIILSSGCRLHLFDLDTGESEAFFTAPTGSRSKFNDGKVDRQGRYVTGTFDPAILDHTRSAEQPNSAGQLLRVDTDLGVHPIGDGTGIINGPCFSPDGATFYVNDSWTRRIYAYDYESEVGTVSNRRVLTEFGDPPAGPDGATVDDEGFLWIAACYGSEVRRYAPDGTVDRRIRLPITKPTSVTFGGADLDVLFVTTMGDARIPRDDTPAGQLGGRLLAVHGIGTCGLPQRRFGG